MTAAYDEALRAFCVRNALDEAILRELIEAGPMQVRIYLSNRGIAANPPQRPQGEPATAPAIKKPGRAAKAVMASLDASSRIYGPSAARMAEVEASWRASGLTGYAAPLVAIGQPTEPLVAVRPESHPGTESAKAESDGVWQRVIAEINATAPPGAVTSDGMGKPKAI
jgi:hypothetical protein